MQTVLNDEAHSRINGPFPCVPLHRHAVTNDWIATRYEDCWRALRSPNFIAVDPISPLRHVAERSGRAMPHLQAFVEISLPTVEGVRHQSMREVFNRTIKSCLSWVPHREFIENRADHLWNAGARDGVLDVVTGYAEPLISTSVANMMDISPEIAINLGRVDGIAGIGNFACSLSILQDYDRRLAELCPLVTDFLDLRIAQERGDPVNVFAKGMTSLGLSEIQLVAAFALLFVISSEQTTSEVALAIHALMCDTDALGAWCGGGIDDNAAVQELLRFTTPVPRVTRVASVDTELGGVHIAHGERVALMIGSANRDASVFDMPDKLVLQRRSNGHIAFAQGSHLCAGKHVATSSLVSALQPLRSNPPKRVLTKDIRWLNQHVLRRMQKLEVAF